MRKSKLDNLGRELPDGRQLEIPLGFRKPERLEDQIQRLVRSHLSRAAAEQGMETFEDADDFEVEDDLDPSTPFEMEFDPVLGREVSPEMLRHDPVRFRDEYVRAAAEHPDTDARIEREQKRFRWPFKRRGKPQDENLGKPKEPRPEGSGSHARGSEAG